VCTNSCEVSVGVSSGVLLMITGWLSSLLSVVCVCVVARGALLDVLLVTFVTNTPFSTLASIITFSAGTQ